MKVFILIQVAFLLGNLMFFYVNQQNRVALQAQSIHKTELQALLTETRAAVEKQDKTFRRAVARVGLNVDDDMSNGSCADEIRMLNEGINETVAAYVSEDSYDEEEIEGYDDYAGEGTYEGEGYADDVPLEEIIDGTAENDGASYESYEH